MKAKALSVRQPWAWLIVNGYKDIENRTWKTSYRGHLYIHASKTFDVHGWRYVKARYPEIPLPNREEFTYGAIIGRVTLVDIVDHSRSRWYDNRLGWVLTDPFRICPVPFNGKLGLWDYEPGKEAL